MQRDSHAQFCTIRADVDTLPSSGPPWMRQVEASSRPCPRRSGRRRASIGRRAAQMAPRDRERLSAKRWTVLVVLLSAPFLAVLDAFIVVLAAPSIRAQLHGSEATVQLAIAAYVLAYAALLITGGRLGDLHGRRRLFVVGLTLFCATSLLAAAAPSQNLLILARFAQGGSAALMYPQTLALLQVHFRGRDWTVAMGAFGVALGLASVTAQLLGGLIVQADLLGLSWRPIFLVNVPVSVAALTLAMLLVPESRSEHAAESLDLAGVAAATVGLLTLVFPLVVGRELGWPAWTWPSLAVAAMAAAAFVLRERRLTGRAGSPLVPLDLFRVRGVALGLVMTLVFYSGQVPLFLLLSLYLQLGLRLSPMTAGLVLVPVAIGFSVSSLTAPWLLARLGRHVVTVGALALAAATGVLGLLALGGGAQPAMAAMVPVLLAVGSGFGLVVPALVAVVLQAVPTEHAGAAAGVLVSVQQIGGAVGIALSGIFFFSLLHTASPPPYARAFAISLAYNIALFIGTALLVQVVHDER